ncbi:hypothetical protein D3C87_1257160 [compost metagenome]|uniref:DUF305 domain-containing protein n=1 Tax=Achromobacter TaxID=222 RepID=UPI000FBC2BC3|nr:MULTISPECIES: DUF305 domain-containing protein [Achromobacter]
MDSTNFLGKIMDHFKISLYARTGVVCRLVALLLGASIATIPFAAPAQTAASPENRPTMGSNPSKADTPADMRDSMMNMQKRMNAFEASGDPDRDFAAMMRMHHMGAVDMAEFELKHGKDPEMRQMAKEIITAQKSEIAKFDAWLAAHKGRAK